MYYIQGTDFDGNRKYLIRAALGRSGWQWTDSFENRAQLRKDEAEDYLWLVIQHNRRLDRSEQIEPTLFKESF